MSSAEAVFASIGVEEHHIVIGTNRKIVVPDELKRIAVQFDNNIETVTFDCPRYWDEHDMSTMAVYINYMRADGKLGSYKAENVHVDDIDDTVMHFDWTISRNVSEVKGSLAILVCVKSVDDEGNEQKHWNSEMCKDMYISDGLECGESIFEQYPDVITQILTEINTIDNKLSKSITDLEKGTIKTVDKANVWELEAGAYYITNSINIAYNPAATHPEFMYQTIYTYGTTGFLFVDIDIKVNDTRNFYFIVGGNLYIGSSTGSADIILPDNEGEEPIETIAATGSYTSVKAKFVDDITDTSQGIATAKGVYNIVKTLESEIPDGVDVQINGRSIVKNGVANIPLGTYNTAGVVKLSNNYGTMSIAKTGIIGIFEAHNNDIDDRKSMYRPIVPFNLDYAVKAAMCDGKGAKWTEEEKAAARARLGIDVILNTLQGNINEISALVGGA